LHSALGPSPILSRGPPSELLSIDEAPGCLAFTDLAFWLRRPLHFEEEPDLPDRFRGALGRRLEELACDDTGDPAADARRLHGLLFGDEASRELGRPFVFRIDVRKDHVKVVLRLFGSAANYWSAAEAAFISCCKQGVALKQNSKHRVRFELVAKEHHACGGLASIAIPQRATLLFRTPVAIRSGRYAKGQLRTLPANIAERLKKLLAWQGTMLAYDRGSLLRAASRLEFEQREMKWRSWTRHSSTTRAGGMLIGGFVGPLRIRGDLEPLWPLLCAGAIMHVGSETALGLGRYDLLGGV
jgi:CRISPR-associated endoribonuclease Cas6